MTQHAIKRLYDQIDKSTQLIQQALDVSYMEALIENGENMVDGKRVRVVAGQPDPKTAQSIQAIYDQMNWQQLDADSIRKSFHLALIKMSQEDYMQANHLTTPDIIGQLIFFFFNLMAPSGLTSVRLLDLACGSGNLLCLLNNALMAHYPAVQAEGVDIDPDLLALAVINSQLQGHKNLKLTQQDGLTPLLVDPVDLVVSDLPVGYYPDQERAQDFDLAADQGLSYAHFLFIEQGLTYLKEGGLGCFILPSSIFTEQSSKNLVQWIQKVGFFQALIQLPASYVKDVAYRQAILVIQKKGPHARQARDVLFASAPEANDDQAVREFMVEIKRWNNQHL